MKTILAFMLLAFSTLAMSQAPSFELFCKGGYIYQVKNPFVFAIFNGGEIAAGEDGRNLAPGTCAWKDRPLSTNEPRRITIPAQGAFSYIVNQAHSMYQMCSIHRKCVIKSRVRNTGSGVFEIDPSVPDITTTSFED